jgi:hypothetical protein
MIDANFIPLGSFPFVFHRHRRASLFFATLSTWFASEYKKSGKKLDMGKGCARFKSLEDLALDVRFAGRELYGGRPRAMASWSREAGDTVLVNTVGRTVARVSAQEHMANYQAARARDRAAQSKAPRSPQ